MEMISHRESEAMPTSGPYWNERTATRYPTTYAIEISNRRHQSAGRWFQPSPSEVTTRRGRGTIAVERTGRCFH
jgi:hypothetical protein